MIRFVFHFLVVIFLTALTQLGGVAWIVASLFRRRLLAFGLLYISLSLSAIWIAPLTGRVALSCFDRGALEVQSMMYCALNRNYVSPALADVLTDAGATLDQRFPGTKTVVLDAGFPFLTGFPLLPHLSHDDGQKADIAFYYQDAKGYLPGATRSPIGYFAFEQGPTTCRPGGMSFRWDLAFLQPIWPDYSLDPARNRAILQILADDPRVGKLFTEPHILRGLNVNHPKIRFQGCHAARHDDHIHLQLR
ncbi:hypothetical protein [Halocynthiibacter sp.]|uniref:hypothetical protein n=1 Tax=Halocynthiibacter sp. TaxID=1979210 RepID=UPI003C3262E1